MPGHVANSNEFRGNLDSDYHRAIADRGPQETASGDGQQDLLQSTGRPGEDRHQRPEGEGVQQKQGEVPGHCPGLSNTGISARSSVAAGTALWPASTACITAMAARHRSSRHAMKASASAWNTGSVEAA